MLALFVHSIPTAAVLFSLAFCLGVSACHLWVLPRTRETEPLFMETDRGSRMIMAEVLVALATGSVVELALRTLEMSGGSVEDLSYLLPIVVFRTHYGNVWIVRAVCIAVITLVWFAMGKQVPSRLRHGITGALALGIAMTICATGHAADAGDFTLPELMDWLHLVGASIWGGGLLTLSLIVFPCMLKQANLTPQVSSGVAERFSRIAGIAVGLVLLSSLYNAWKYMGSVDALVLTAYGRTIAAKIVLLVLLLLLGAYNRYVSVPRMQKMAGCEMPGQGIVGRLVLPVLLPLARDPKDDRIYDRFIRSVRLEAFLIAGVLLIAAVLRHEVPARHALHSGHSGVTDHEHLHHHADP